MRLDIVLDSGYCNIKRVVFSWYKGYITLKSCNFQNLPDSCSCSTICHYPLSPYIHIIYHNIDIKVIPQKYCDI